MIYMKPFPPYIPPAEAQRTIAAVAREIQDHWGHKVNYAAKSYLQAMCYLRTPSDKYGLDNAKDIVRYFLSNSTTFRGPDAKRLKAELKAICNIK